MDDREAHEFYADPANLTISGPGRKRQRQRLSGMTSVRFAPEVIAAIKERALREGVTVGSWIRRLVDREITQPRTFDLPVPGEGEPARIPADALERVSAALMPALMRHGQGEDHMSDTITVYVSIGNSDDKLTQARWSEFHGLVTAHVRDRACEVYGSWVSPSASPWQNACIAFALDADEIPILKSELRDLAAVFDQDSIAWAAAQATEFIGPGEVSPA